MTLLKSLQIFAQQSGLLGQKSGSYIEVYETFVYFGQVRFQSEVAWLIRFNVPISL